jgi:hypothetical protein
MLEELLGGSRMISLICSSILRVFLCAVFNVALILWVVAMVLAELGLR